MLGMTRAHPMHDIALACGRAQEILKLYTVSKTELYFEHVPIIFFSLSFFLSVFFFFFDLFGCLFLCFRIQKDALGTNKTFQIACMLNFHTISGLRWHFNVDNFFFVVLLILFACSKFESCFFFFFFHPSQIRMELNDSHQFDILHQIFMKYLNLIYKHYHHMHSNWLLLSYNVIANSFLVLIVYHASALLSLLGCAKLIQCIQQQQKWYVFEWCGQNWWKFNELPIHYFMHTKMPTPELLKANEDLRHEFRLRVTYFMEDEFLFKQHSSPLFFHAAFISI